jgi:hypothetical protein
LSEGLVRAPTSMSTWKPSIDVRRSQYSSQVVPDRKWLHLLLSCQHIVDKQSLDEQPSVAGQSSRDSWIGRAQRRLRVVANWPSRWQAQLALFPLLLDKVSALTSGNATIVTSTARKTGIGILTKRVGWSGGSCNGISARFVVVRFRASRANG